MTSSHREQKIWRVGDLASNLKHLIEETYTRVVVRGEIGQVSRASSGHVYFSLKDNRALISAVVWRTSRSHLTKDIQEGADVICYGRLTTYLDGSRYQIIVHKIEMSGIGALMALFEKRKKILQQEGLFEEAHKKHLPFLPSLIAVITSPTGAVIQDILHRLRARFPTRVVIWPVRVQGDGAAQEIANAIRALNQPQTLFEKPNLIIVARGGGSLEDLWCFNEEEIVRAAFESDIPLMSAIGHETDITLIDYVADQRAPTPSAAAEIAVPVHIDLLRRLQNLTTIRLTHISTRFKTYRLHLNHLSGTFSRKRSILEQAYQRLDARTHLLQHARERMLMQKRAQLQKFPSFKQHTLTQYTQSKRVLHDLLLHLRIHARRSFFEQRNIFLALEAHLKANDPQTILARGFALVRLTSTGALVNNPGDIPPGAYVDVEWTQHKTVRLMKPKRDTTKQRRKKKDEDKKEMYTPSLFDNKS